ncbi:MAG: hypothetical protein ACM3ML_32470 [Micromonosporaceae bacterium]
MATYEKILALFAADEPPVPSLLPWVARGAAEADLLRLARIAAAQTALAPMRRWPVVADATAEVLAVRGTVWPDLLPSLVEVLPPVIAFLNKEQVGDLIGSGVRADAAAYAALRYPGAWMAKSAPESLHPLWREVLTAERTGLPPLANLRLLARLAGDALDQARLSGSELVYLLPFLGHEWAGDAGPRMAVAEIRDWLETESPWYAAALFSRAAPYLGHAWRSEVMDKTAALPREWAELFGGLSRKGRSPWHSAVPEIAAAHPALAELDRLADEATDEELAHACADIAARMPVDPALERWEPESAAPKPAPLEQRRQATVAPPDREDRVQVPLGGPSAEPGAGERAQLPGMSSRYRALTFVCPQCKAREYRVYYDERDLPVCKHEKDVPMRFQG